VAAETPSLDTIFCAAVEMASADERAAYVARTCGDDRELQARVEKLVDAHFRAGSFLEESAPAPGATGSFVSPSPERPALAEGPGTVIGPYKLLQQIGEGGMGAVFMAEQTQPVRRMVALKLIKPGMDSRQIIARFEAERQALALMDHVNIARVLDAGATESGRPYFVMELVHGVPITKYCDDNQLTPRERLELFVPVCQAIQHAHQKGVIHRDVKPSNVMVTLYDGKPVPKVIDFGVAKATEQKLTERTLFTQYGTMVGTLEYMSPEQAEMSALGVDTRSDVYSLGVLLYELLTGSTPLTRKRFKDAAYGEILRLIKEEEPPKPSTRLTDSGEALASISAQRKTEPAKLSKLMRGELDWIVMKTLEKDRNRRYETASGFAADVQRYLNDEPVQACPPTAGYRLRKFARRNKAALGTVTVAALALCVAAGALVVSNIRISGESAEKAKALEAATASEQEAQESLKDALAAVDQMLTRVSEEHLQFVPQMEPVRRDLLQDALKFYQKFLARWSKDPAVRRETALAYRRMGFLHYQLGDYVEAEDAYRKAFAMLDELDAVSPLDPGARSELIFSHIECSLVLDNQGKAEEREKALRRAVAIGEALVKQFPEGPSYRDQLTNASNRLADAIAAREPAEAERVLRRNLDLSKESTDSWLRGQTWLNLGTLLANQRRHAEAADACRQAIPFFEKAAEQSPSLPWLHVGVCEALEQLAAAVDAQGRPQEAEESYRRVIAILDGLARDYPAGPHYRWGQATARFKHAALLRKLQRPTEAEEAYRRAVALSDKLADDFPTLPGYQWTAVDRRRVLAQFLAETGHVQEAQEVYGGAAGLLEKLAAPERSKALKARGHFYSELGEWDKAAGDFTKAIDLGSDDVMGVWYPLAVLHLRAQRTDEYRALCERLLKQLPQTEDHYVVIICKLAPNAVADLSQPVHVAEKLVAREPQNAEYIGLLGAALYRKGDAKAAVEKLEEGIRSGSEQTGVYWRKLVLAMAYHSLGRGPEARQLFEEVRQWTEQNGQEKFSWANRLDLQLLHHEAEEFLKQDFDGKRQKSEKKR
jgi:serine/threonine protein kinase